MDKTCHQERKSRQELAERFFALSPLKREKLRALRSLFPAGLATRPFRALDVGSDNGVISHMLRCEGGEWASVDLSEHTVALIQELVEGDVKQTDGKSLDFPSGDFDVVVIVDLLEHIETDSEFLREVRRVLKEEGVLIVNVPNPTEGWLRRLRFAVGQTDEKHGHLRPGYSERELQSLCEAAGFERLAQRRYVGFFTTLIDMFIGIGLSLKSMGRGGVKGKVVDAKELGKSSGSVLLLKLIKPLFEVALMLDRCLPLMRGQMLAMSFRVQQPER